MAKKKTSAKTKRVFALKNGDEYDVISETGKYYICNGTQFRKSANRGVIWLKEIEEPKQTEETPVEPTQEETEE